MFATGRRAGRRCLNLTTASARAVFACIWTLFSLSLLSHTFRYSWSWTAACQVVILLSGSELLPRKKTLNFASEIAHFIVFWVTILYLCNYHVYNSMQQMWKQSPKQSVYDIRLHTKKPCYQKLHGDRGHYTLPWIRHWSAGTKQKDVLMEVQNIIFPGVKGRALNGKAQLAEQKPQSRLSMLNLWRGFCWPANWNVAAVSVLLWLVACWMHRRWQCCRELCMWLLCINVICSIIYSVFPAFQMIRDSFVELCYRACRKLQKYKNWLPWKFWTRL